MNLYDIAIARKLSGGGGGGSSDFSTATITVVGNLPASFNGAFVVDDNETSWEGRMLPPISPTATVILYKGRAIIEDGDGQIAQIVIPPEETNIVYDDDEEYYIVTGNCTINTTAP